MNSAAWHPTPRTGRDQRLAGRPLPAPPLPRSYVPRPGLWKVLDRASSGAVTVLTGPTGAGKTLGVSGWLRQGADASVAWIDAVSHGSPLRLRSLLDGARGSISGVGVASGVSGVRQGPTQPRLIVIDDAHRLAPESLALIAERLNEEPERLRLLLLSRWGLPLDLLSSQLMGQFTALGGEILRMAPDEAETLVRAHAPEADSRMTAAIVSGTQGWPGALVLAARAAALDPGADPADGLASSVKAVRMLAGQVFHGLSDSQRHLLLCTAAEQVVTPLQAAHLTRDAHAVEALSELEATGLLVHRVPQEPDAWTDDPPAEPDQRHRRPAPSDGPGNPGNPVHLVSAAGGSPRYGVHPLLHQAVLLELDRDGDQVRAARESVARAVQLDVLRGCTDGAFARLVSVGATAAAARLLALNGVGMAMRGEGDQIVEFVGRHPEVVLGEPAAWFAVTVERWVAGDVAGARHWMEVLLDSDYIAQPASCVQLACLRLMRSRLGLEPVEGAVAQARQMLASPHPQAPRVDIPLLLHELAITLNWTGELAEAERHFSTAIALARSGRLPSVEVAAMSHLALTEFMRGRERAAVDLATDTFAQLGDSDRWYERFTSARTGLALYLAGVSMPPWPAPMLSPPQPEWSPVHPADLCTLFWRDLRDVSLALASGDVAEAVGVLERPLPVPEQFGTGAAAQLPRHLQVTWLTMRLLLAVLSSDGVTLRSVADELRAGGAEGEAALGDGFAADLAGDLHAARRSFESAITECRCTQPPTVEIATVCLAQVLASLDDQAGAMAHLRVAVLGSQVRRNAVPFLGWLRHGRSVALLLAQLGEAETSPWLGQLTESVCATPDIVRHCGPEALSATSGEATIPVPGSPMPVLTSRERDVLAGLARGCTYADMGAELFVAESTVKTHVSSLYAKLGAARRSEALAIARHLRLV